jgi:hypothetical protein
MPHRTGFFTEGQNTYNEALERDKKGQSEKVKDSVDNLCSNKDSARGSYP